MTAAGRLAGRCEHCRPQAAFRRLPGAQRRGKSRRSSLCGCGGKVLPPRRDKGRAKCRTPQSPAVTAPLTGEPSNGRRPQRLPCKGSWLRRKAQTEGCRALWCKYPSGPSRRCKSRKSSLCGCGGKVLPPRRDKGRAKCRTPQSPAATAPLTGEPSNGRRLQRLPCKGSWLRRKAQTEGCRALRCNYPSGPLRRRAAPVFRHRAFCAGLPAGGAGALSGQEKSNIKGESVCPNCILSCPWPGGAAAFLKTALCSPSR